MRGASVKITTKNVGAAVTAKVTLPDFPFIPPVSMADLRNYEHYRGKKDIIVIGQGGSVSSLRYIVGALPATSTFHLIDIQDPYLLQKTKASVDPQHTLVITISKSGNTLSVIQNAAYFADFHQLIITEDAGALAHVADTANIPHIHHPPVGGRFIGTSLPCLLPAYLGGIDVEPIISGAEKIYADAKTLDTDKNIAWKSALLVHEGEEHGYSDVYMPIYDNRYASADELIMQICHETYCKHGKGNTILPVAAPECQHHSNQRFLGGPHNMFGFFISVNPVANTESKIYIPENWRNVTVGTGTVGDLHDVAHTTALRAELDGVLAHCGQAGIPYIHLENEDNSAQAVGKFIAFWQLFAVYSALVRDVNPYDQPEVEFAKNATRKILLK